MSQQRLCPDCLEIECTCSEAKRAFRNVSAKSKHIELDLAKSTGEVRMIPNLPKYMRDRVSGVGVAFSSHRPITLSAVAGEVFITDHTGDAVAIDGELLEEHLRAINAIARAQRRLRK